VKAVVAERDTDGRLVPRLVIADLKPEPLEQGAQQRFGRRSQPFGRDQGEQVQQVHRLLIGFRPFSYHGPQPGQFGLLLAVQFSEPPSDLLEQDPTWVVALLERANKARLAALEVGKRSLERLDPRLPCRDLATGDIGKVSSTIAAVPRRYVLFCGAVFKPLLGEHVTRWHEFHLRKKDGTLARQRCYFANLLLPHEGGYMRAGLAQSWARQGIPMAAYAEEIRSRYEDAAQ